MGNFISDCPIFKKHLNSKHQYAENTVKTFDAQTIRSVLLGFFFTDFQMGIALQEVNFCLEAKEMIQEQIVKPDEETFRSSYAALKHYSIFFT